MRLFHQVSDGIQTVRILDRRLDASFADDFTPHVSDLIASGPHLMVIDLSNVDFIDSRGIGAILAIYKSVAADGELVISGVRETILSLFRLARINNIIRIYQTEEQAIAALRQMPEQVSSVLA